MLMPIPDPAARALERTALALGRLDAALASHPLRAAWTHWSVLDAACRQAATDGHAANPHRLAAFLEGLPLTVNRDLDLAERGSEHRALAHAAALVSWMANPDPESLAQRDDALSTFRTAAAGGPILEGTARALLAWVKAGGSRAAGRAAVPLHLAARGVLTTALPPVTGAAAFAARDEQQPFVLRFLTALTDEAQDGLERLQRLERAWRHGRLAVADRTRRSRISSAVDLLAAFPLISPSKLADALGCSVPGASAMLTDLWRLGVAVEVTGIPGRGARKLYGLTPMAPIRAETSARRRRDPGRGRGRPPLDATQKPVRMPALDLPIEIIAEGSPAPPARLDFLSVDYTALERAMDGADAVSQRVKRLLDQLTGEVMAA